MTDLSASSQVGVAPLDEHYRHDDQRDDEHVLARLHQRLLRRQLAMAGLLAQVRGSAADVCTRWPLFPSRLKD